MTAAAFVKELRAGTNFRGAFEAQAAGVFLSNQEEDEDNFVLVSTPRLVGFFAGRGLNVVLQKPAAQLRDGGCALDDGSLSVYSALSDIPYVCLEADASGGGARQAQMFEAVYQLLKEAGAARP